MRVLFALLALAVSVSAQGLTGPNFYIVNATTNFDAYNFLIDGAIVPDPSLSLTVGTTYKFILNASMNIHPFGFSGDNDANTVTFVNLTSADQGGVSLSGSCGQSTADNKPLAWITTQGNEANPCIISITPPAALAGQSIYYRCGIHKSMVGTLTAVAATGGSTTAPPSATTAPPSATTAPPSGTTAPPKSSAAVIVPGATAVIIAAINALFSA